LAPFHDPIPMVASLFSTASHAYEYKHFLYVLAMKLNSENPLKLNPRQWGYSV